MVLSGGIKKCETFVPKTKTNDAEQTRPAQTWSGFQKNTTKKKTMPQHKNVKQMSKRDMSVES